MFGRLLLGLVIGLVVGGLVAVALVAGLHVSFFGPGTGEAALAYVTAALTGVLTGLVAGKPIWATGAKIEAGLKAFFGALLGAGLLFALRQWGGALGDVPAFAMNAVGASGQVPFGDFPAVALPLLAAVLGGFFGLDNTGTDESEAKKDAGPERKRVAVAGANGTGKARVASEADESEADEPGPVASKRAKR